MDVMGKLAELPIKDVLLILREEHRQRTDGYATYLAHGGKGDPAEEVSLDALAMAISALEKTKWISVDDMLPEEECRCLVIDEAGDIEMDFYNGKGRFVLDHSGAVQHPSHWMQLPKMPHPPKGE